MKKFIPDPVYTKRGKPFKPLDIFKKEEKEEEGIKYDTEKPKMNLLPPKAVLEVAKVLTFGAEKYDAENWRKLDNLQSRYTAGALRHIFAHMDGEQLDPETELSHLAHALCCLLFKLEIELEDAES